jgi:very-short-patch-repair endonuclease
VSAEKKEFARELRRNPTGVYDCLWQELRKNKLGVRFHRRKIIYGWIPDFWCPSAKLAIDIDYASDVERQAEHARTDEVLAQRGIYMMRISEAKIMTDLGSVLTEIKDVLSQRIAE